MALSIAQRLPTPSNEWAEHTTHALQGTGEGRTVSPTSANSNNSVQAPTHIVPSIASSALSTPGLEIPGAFPKMNPSVQNTGNNGIVPTALDDRSPHVAIEKLANTAPSKDLGDIDIGTLKKEAARLFEVAKQYVPGTENIQGVVTNAASPSLGNITGDLATEQEKISNSSSIGAAKISEMRSDTEFAPPATDLAADLHRTTPAKPEIIIPSPNDSDVDNASVRAIPPSTRSPSYQFDAPSDTTSGTNFGAYLDPTASAKQSNNAHSAASAVPVTDVDVASSLPTPPPSEAAVPSASSQLRKADASGISSDGAAASKKSSLDAHRFSLDQPAQPHNGVRVGNAAHSASDPGDLSESQHQSPSSEKLQSKEGKEGGMKGLVQRVKGRLSIHHKDKSGTTGH